MRRDEFLNILRYALIKLIKEDGKIVDRKLNEVCINHKFAMYLEQELFKVKSLNYLSVDLEYDKNYKDRKVIVTSFGKRNIRPDIIIHQRENNYYNMVGIECKKGYANKEDIDKLLALLKHPYEYVLSCAVSYLPGKNYMRIKIYYDNEEYCYKFDKGTGTLQDSR